MVAEMEVLYSRNRSAANRDGSMSVDPDTVFATVLMYVGETPVAHAALRRLDGEQA